MFSCEMMLVVFDVVTCMSGWSSGLECLLGCLKKNTECDGAGEQTSGKCDTVGSDSLT